MSAQRIGFGVDWPRFGGFGDFSRIGGFEDCPRWQKGLLSLSRQKQVCHVFFLICQLSVAIVVALDLKLKGLSRILELLSFLVVVVTFPVSLFFTLKTTKEYERVVIFRLGRSLGRAR